VNAIRSYAPLGLSFTTSLRPAVAAGAAASSAFLKTAPELREKHQRRPKLLKLRLKGWVCSDHRSRQAISSLLIRRNRCSYQDFVRPLYWKIMAFDVQADQLPQQSPANRGLRFTPSPVHGPLEIEGLGSRNGRP